VKMPDFPESVPTRPVRPVTDPYGRKAPDAAPQSRTRTSAVPEAAPPLSAKDRALRRVIEFGLLALLVFSPLPIGSVEDGPILVIELAAVVLTIFYFLMDKPPRVNAALKPKLRWPRLFFGLLLAFMALQIVPLPAAIVRILSPRAFALRLQFLPAGPGGWISLSLLPARTFRSLLEFLAYVLIGFLVVRTVTHARQVRRLIAVLVVMGVFEVFYGLFELTQSAPRLLFYPKIYMLGSPTGTFVNRNHFSGYLELIIPLAIGLLLSRAGAFSLRGRKWREKVALLTAKGAFVNLLVLAALFVLFLGVLKSNSRAGTFILAMILLLVFGLSAYAFSAARYQQVWVRAFLRGMVGMIVLLVLYFGFDATVRRFSADNLLHEGRPKTWGSTLTMIGDFPLVGSGYGTFPAVFPVYEDPGLDNPVVHAHNDYLEYTAELGLLGFGLLVAGVLALGVTAFRTWSERHNPEIKGLVLGGLVSVAAMLFHSVTDFNLHIPANVLLFAVVLSLTFGTAFYQKGT
jgi:O-antigen ligase